MKLRRFILFIFCVFAAYGTQAQSEGGLIQSRVLILLDESSSMTLPWASGKEKYKAARELILKLMDSVYAVNKQVEFSLRVFGHQHTVPENDCYDTRNEVPFSRDNRGQMQARLEDIHPLGVTPIGFALKEAAEKDIVDENHNAYSIILITDGGESCGGDICDVMKKLMKYKVYFKPYIVSLENDPSLKTTYACMGDFLQVTREKDIPKAVSVIVEAFRPVIKINSEEYKKMQNISANAPSILKVNTPVIKPDEPKKWAVVIDNIASLPFSVVSMKSITILSAPAKTTKASMQLPKVVVDTPVPRTVVKYAALPTSKPRLIITGTPVAGKKSLVTNGFELPKLIIDTPVAPRKADVIAKLKLSRPNRLNVIFVIEDHTYRIRPIPALPPVKVEIVADKPAPEKAPKHEFKVETTDDKETTVSVYFTNGKGKYYTTSPQVVLLDPATKKPVRKFFRTVDPTGNPDPQTGIPAGVYDLTLTVRPDYLLTGIQVLPNKNNKVTVTVKSTSLSFAYENAPKRPVKEFMAVVTERTKEHGRVQDQKCIEAILYEPGNYHIEINTFPQDVRNVDLDFDGETVITIEQPGFAKFTGDGKIKSVTLFRQYGNKYLGFYTLELKDPKSQHLQIQPGEYQVHYQKGPAVGYAAEQVLQFHIKPNEETEIILK